MFFLRHALHRDPLPSVASPDRDTRGNLPKLSDQQGRALMDLLRDRPTWYHSWQVTEDLALPGHVSVQETLRVFRVSLDLRGAKILDVGTCNGAFAFELERRGAEVTAVDICSPDEYGFESLAQILRSRVRYLQASVYDLDARFPRNEFDYILFSGVLYHLRHPLLALDNLHRISKSAVWLESHVIDHYVMVRGKPRRLPSRFRHAGILQFYRSAELNDDPSNFFGFSIHCIESMLWSCGFRPVLRHASRTRAYFHAEKMGGAPEYERLLMDKRPSYCYPAGIR